APSITASMARPRVRAATADISPTPALDGRLMPPAQAISTGLWGSGLQRQLIRSMLRALCASIRVDLPPRDCNFLPQAHRPCRFGRTETTSILLHTLMRTSRPLIIQV